MQGQELIPGLELGSVLGEGDFSTVFRGTFEGTQVAVKMLRPEKPANRGRDVESDFRSELQVLEKLDHQNCVRLLSSGPRSLVTDLAHGEPLSAILYGKKLRLPSPMVFARQLAEAVSYLHQLAPVILHRDIKPENVVVDTKSSGLKLIDFGMAQPAGVAKTTRTMDGSPLYLAPEGLDGAAASVATEVWALACVVVEMFGSGRPFERQGVRGLADLRQKASAGVRPFPTLPPLVKENAFALEPSKRPSASELARALA